MWQLKKYACRRKAYNCKSQSYGDMLRGRGNKGYFTKNECGKRISDAAGTKKIREKDIQIPAARHSFGEWQND